MTSESGRIEFESVSKSFSPRKNVTTTALHEISLTVDPGSIFGVIGYSGAGKSTLIRLVNGLERPSTGRVLVDGLDVGTLKGRRLREAQKRTGMIFQQFNLLETVKVRDNVAMPLRLDGVGAAAARAKAEEVLDFVGLSSKADSFAGDLSGGQKQRVGIARALVRNPRILLSDEATSALDPTTTAQIIELLRSINREYGTTILVVTHEMDVIKDLAHRVAVVADGTVVEQGTVLDTFLRPRSPITRDFVTTVVPQGLPDRVIDHLGGDGLWRLLLLDEQVTQPLLSDLISKLGVEVNMLHADMTEIQEHTVGQMIVKVTGAPDRVAAARAFLTERVVHLEEVRP
ncbi:ATP-binding cassette domain-containing protein [Herbiconiux moechotypicola]|uniref:ATP-binding cassette domain-containing protein n=1 Tax=Herbiconiux moechotypicola TaxID=637393 RepID=A0ABN3E4S1_9MICO|nr:ATP-binding cassette domain-containing protein [Herbiconiux moechotypicola]MCS5731825.1 ATP-binding cassette domain-containing protein [Herbiconiux moechotypicola]